MPAPATENLPKPVKDAVYVGVGLSILAFQKLQVRRRELEKAVRGALGRD